MNRKIEDEAPLWFREFDTGLAPGWREDDRLLYAECLQCTRAVWRSSRQDSVEWTHYNPPQFHKPEYPVPCFTPEPRPDTVIGEVKKQPEPDSIFQKKMDKPPESAEMLLFMMSAQDRFLFGALAERLRKFFTPGEFSLVQRMLLSLKSEYVLNMEVPEVSDDTPFVPDPSGTTEKAEATQRKEDAQRPKEKDNPEGVIPPAEKKPKK